MNSSWIIKEQDPVLVERLAKELNLHRITTKILINRGLTTTASAQKFLNPLLSNLPDPSLLPDMDKAVNKIVDTVRENKKIAIFGDYDTDGVTSTALLVRFFRDCGIFVDSYIPNRLSEGYGLNRRGIDYLKDRDVSLIITTDNGVSGHTEIDYANSLGIKTIVTDHHEVPNRLPNAYAVVNPKRLGDDNRFGELAGVGVAFYMAAALRAKFRSEGIIRDREPDLKSYLDLVAVGTVADVVPLIGVNRILVKHGLEILKHTANPGLKALTLASATDPLRLDTMSIGFRLAPRLNAAGRLGKQNISLQLLTTDDREEAREIAATLNRMNSERQGLEKKILKEMNLLLDNFDDSKSSIVLWSKEWHPGVIGIVASRLTDSHRRPCALISIDGDMGRGSVRTVGNYNVMESLYSCGNLLKNFGGHTAAAGFDIEVDNLKTFSELFEEHASRHLTERDKTPSFLFDSEIEISEIDSKLIEELNTIEPFGEGNKKPLLALTPSTVENVRVVGGSHLKLKIKSGRRRLDAIGFNMGDTDISLGKEYQFAGTPEFNEWNNTTTIQFKIQDIKTAQHFKKE